MKIKIIVTQFNEKKRIPISDADIQGISRRKHKHLTHPFDSKLRCFFGLTDLEISALSFKSAIIGDFTA